ncbi:GTP cyclohydrolase I FolE [Haloarcula sp. JP-Z28]|uniref:GTP cyclohydrolase I n=1 Tax=Haloarcula sp. JP-Z28 TaxID=2716715 RepID=UPI001404B447|nr:GTP cyclohydrolase I [Haloarcula sp. JP-Z28]NHN64373.1 GTP cyclohydrolase I FolE [Haloarcula sp. JP-Z28]
MTDDVQTEPVESVESVNDRETAIDWSKAQEGVRLLLEAVGEDPESAELQETWQRRVPGAFETLTEGSRLEEKPELRTFEASGNNFVVKTGIPVYSLCERHLLPYFGTATVAYRPDGDVVGLSKLSRYVRWQSRQLTMQEQLTQNIAHGLSDEVGAEAVLVEISATHLCEAMRGVETQTETVTRAVAGEPTEEERQRFNEASN